MNLLLFFTLLYYCCHHTELAMVFVNLATMFATDQAFHFCFSHICFLGACLLCNSVHTFLLIAILYSIRTLIPLLAYYMTILCCIPHTAVDLMYQKPQKDLVERTALGTCGLHWKLDFMLSTYKMGVFTTEPFLGPSCFSCHWRCLHKHINKANVKKLIIYIFFYVF